MDWLKELLKNAGIEDTKIDEIVGSFNKEVPKYLIPKDKYNELSEAKKDLETQLNTANTTIADLKKGNKDNEELQNKIKQYETDLETLKADSETKIKNLTLDSAIKLALKDNKAKHEDLLIGRFDREKLTIKEDGTIEGLEDQIKGLKEAYKDLFEQPLSGKTPPNNGKSNPSYNPWSKEHFNLTQQGKILRENPELAAQLKSAAN